jgi:hypothetical protein
MIRAALLVLGACGPAVAPVAAPVHTATVTPVASANQDVHIPIKLVAVRTADTISVRIDRALGTVTVPVDPSLHLGNSYELRIYPEGQAPMASANGYASGTDFDLGEHHVAATAKRYIVELVLVVFETDLAPDHMWRPEQGARYKVLWTNTLRDTVD